MNRTVLVVATLVLGCLAEGLVAFHFMERHWNQVTWRLSEAMARDMAAIVDLHEVSSTNEDIARLTRIALDKLGLSVTVLPAGELPTPRPKPFFDLFDRTLSEAIRANVRYPFWIDTVGQSRHVEVRIKLDQAILRFVAPRARTHASNSHIFLTLIGGSWVILLAVGYLVLRRGRAAPAVAPCPGI
jgi:two-component system osmolarity sensor histidine kinase EnvZ